MTSSGDCDHVGLCSTFSGGDQSQPGHAGRTQWCACCGAIRTETSECGEWVWSIWHIPSQTLMYTSSSANDFFSAVHNPLMFAAAYHGFMQGLRRADEALRWATD